MSTVRIFIDRGSGKLLRLISPCSVIVWTRVSLLCLFVSAARDPESLRGFRGWYPLRSDVPSPPILSCFHWPGRVFLPTYHKRWPEPNPPNSEGAPASGW